MRQAAGPRFRRVVRRATTHPFRAAMVGIGAGAVIQSTNAVTYIVVGLVSAGAVTVQAGMPIVTWCYAGTSLRLLLVSIDTAVLPYALMAGAGLAYFLDWEKSPRYGFVVNALLGLGLLLTGAQLTAAAAVPLGESETIRAAIAVADRFYFWGFVVGATLASFMQGMTVSVIAVALVSAGALGLDQTMLVVTGANLGSGILSWIQGASLEGTERQLSVYQFVLKGIGACVLLPLLAVEHFTGLPTVVALTGAVTSSLALRVTLVHWIFQIAAALVASPLNGPIHALVARLCPATEEETLSQPEHLYRPPPATAEEAARQAAREQSRLLHRLPAFLDGLRPEERDAGKPDLAALRASGRTLNGEIGAFLQEALSQAEEGPASGRLVRLARANEVLATLQEELAAFVGALPRRGENAAADRTTGILVESLHAILEIAASELDDERFDPELLSRLTADRASVLHDVREGIGGGDAPGSAEVRLGLWRSLDAFERLLWLLRRHVWSRCVPVADSAAQRGASTVIR